MKSTTLLLALVLSCGGDDESQTTTTTTNETTTGEETTTTSVAQDVLVIAPFTLTDSGGQSISMTADGRLTMPSETRPGPLFQADGTITMDGDPLASFSADGTLTASTGETIAVIAEDGSTSINNLDLSWGADGNLVGGNPDGPGLSIEPADSPAKRAATAVVLMMTMGRSTETGPVGEDAVEEEAAEAAP